jgi:hypothetical protein
VSDFKFGTCYPLASRTSTDPGDLIWIEASAALPPRSWRSAKWVDEHQGWHRAVLWMPAPPSPEELAANPIGLCELVIGQYAKLLSLESGLRKRLDYLKSLPPGLVGPRFAAREMLREELEVMLKEAGLE